MKSCLPLMRFRRSFSRFLNGAIYFSTSPRAPLSKLLRPQPPKRDTPFKWLKSMCLLINPPVHHPRCQDSAQPEPRYSKHTYIIIFCESFRPVNIQFALPNSSGRPTQTARISTRNRNLLIHRAKRMPRQAVCREESAVRDAMSHV